jgi:AcrR family transcriptional regulator
MSSSEVTRRDRKRLATRDAIRGAALDLFMDRGFDMVSVDQVAEAADVGASTVYRHFPTKEDLVLGHLAGRQAAFVDLLEQVGGVLTVGELLVATTLAWAPDAEAQGLLRAEIGLVVATPSLLARLQHQTVDWEFPINEVLARRCGLPDTDLELRQLTALFCATIRIVIREWTARASDEDLVAFGRVAVEALDHLPAASLELVDR